MRAAFNTTVTLFDGPGTATPYFPRVVGAQCRVVPNTFFVGLQDPDNLALAYFTIASTTPNGPGMEAVVADVWKRDYNKSDIAEFAALPGLFWQVTRVDSCTWPSPRAPYSRAFIREGVGPPPACSTFLPETYPIFDNNTMSAIVLLRLGPYAWGADGWFLEQLPAPLYPDCTSDWRLVNSEGTVWTRSTWNGRSIVNFTNDGGFLDVRVFYF